MDRRTQQMGWLFLVSVLPIAAGCGGGYKKELAPVSGTVKCNGELLTEGWVIFTPKQDLVGETDYDIGKPARGRLNEKGEFILSTYDEEDGAKIGMHTVTVMQLDPEDDEAPVRDQGYACGIQEEPLEVKDDDNVFHIELTNPPDPSKRPKR